MRSLAFRCIYGGECDSLSEGFAPLCRLVGLSRDEAIITPIEKPGIRFATYRRDAGVRAMSIVTRLLDHFLMLTFCSTATRVAVAIVIASLLFSSRTVVFAESKVQLGAPSLTSGIRARES